MMKRNLHIAHNPDGFYQMYAYRIGEPKPIPFAKFATWSELTNFLVRMGVPTETAEAYRMKTARPGRQYHLAFDLPDEIEEQITKLFEKQSGVQQ